MPNIITKVCFDRVIPAELLNIADERAIAENSANASPFEVAGVQSKFWKPGRKLRVCFLEGEKSVQHKVMELAQTWSDYANIEFDFGDAQNAEIRIAFQDDGSWSAIGTDALVTEFFPAGTATMNYGWLTPDTDDAEYAAVVLHEFGHALGLIHEHQNPANKIQWNYPVVIEALKGKPNQWTDEEIAFNMFQKYDMNQTQFTEFDPASIMLYDFPSEWTLNGMTFPRHSKLSDMDKEFIAQCYPR